MSWFGKILGGTIGLVIGGGPLGAVAGAAIGHHLFDKQPQEAGGSRPGSSRRVWSQEGGFRTGGAPWGQQTQGHGEQRHREERQAAFFLALFSILGKLAKADGRITREQGEAAISFLDRMGVTGQQRAFAIRVFNEAKNSPYSVEDFARQFAQCTRNQPDLRASLIDMLFETALANKEFHPQEEKIISSVASVLGVSAAELRAIRDKHLGGADYAFSVLGLTPEASDDELRQTYRQLVQEYHPDRIVAQGMPQEFVEYASERFQEIQEAWNTIKRDRGL
ncbi:DnaJ like chaperone protein [Alkalispirochaeta americana]|uniref:DnaJ like chaperone protein n=1 Tax=Alkalispirochaeta americana TaxID=159291 RepID=A0A1N6RCJ1_9SPIO|nr:TerB family tellurite resistance protein [Alkalispirochaeta americana]SIQ26559.1 DnaJ like chaperone protein [Alkalispirochaeta americana]